MTTATNTLAPHEMLEVLEVLTFKNVCLTKSKTMQALVQDEELKTILQADVKNSAKDIMELRSLLQKVH
jgi:similar to spore coat protein